MLNLTIIIVCLAVIAGCVAWFFPALDDAREAGLYRRKDDDAL